MLEYVAITVAAVAGEHGFQEDVLRQQNLLDVAVVNQLADRAGVLLVGGRLRRLVGRIEGGLNINSVPDRTRFDVDIRSAPNLQHATIRERLTTLLGESVTVSTLVDLPAVLSREDHAWIKQVYQRCQPLHAEPIAPRVVPYFTDASLLLPALGDPPCIILGPGEPSMAHQTDEYCLLSRLVEAEQLYGDIIRDWMASPPATKVKNE